jgi:hypothetical protein
VDKSPVALDSFTVSVQEQHAMNTIILALCLTSQAAPKMPANPVFQELLDRGVSVGKGEPIKLPPPILADGLDAVGQRAALEKIADEKYPLKRLLEKSFYAPVVVKVRTIVKSEDEGPAVRAIDLWFVVHGDWQRLTSEKFLETAFKSSDESGSRIVKRSGILDAEELSRRKLSATSADGADERFVYSTFTLFERVELSATRRAMFNRGQDSILAAAMVDRRFDADADYPNQWRPLLRDAQANIKPGKPKPFRHAGGYAKITRLLEPAGAAFIEFHLIYEEDYAWFDGANLVKQKLPAMVQEKVRSFRRKLGETVKPAE